MDYRPRHMPITHHDLYTTPYIEYAAEGLTGRTRVRRTAYDSETKDSTVTS